MLQSGTLGRSGAVRCGVRILQRTGRRFLACHRLRRLHLMRWRGQARAMRCVCSRDGFVLFAVRLYCLRGTTDHRLSRAVQDLRATPMPPFLPMRACLRFGLSHLQRITQKCPNAGRLQPARVKALQTRVDRRTGACYCNVTTCLTEKIFTMAAAYSRLL